MTGIYFATPMLATAALLTISDSSFSHSIQPDTRETLWVPPLAGPVTGSLPCSDD